MFISPFKILYELIVFGVQAAFIYGLLLIAVIAFCIYLFAGLETHEPNKAIEIVKTIEVVKEVKPVYECLKVDGCSLNTAAETIEEYCPSCVKKFQ